MPVPASAAPDLRAYLEEIEKRLDNVERVKPVKVRMYTKATLPSASDSRFKSSIALVSDGTSSKAIVISDNTIWRYADGNAV